MTRPHNLVAVVPHAFVAKMQAKGWRGIRQNGFTVTMSSCFPDAEAATQAGRKLALVWSVEPA